MGISISHGVQNTRSATTIGNLGQHLAHVLTSSDWQAVRHLFDGRVSPPLTVPSAEAGRIGSILSAAARQRSMEPGWGELAIELGNAATRAARAGQNWEWT